MERSLQMVDLQGQYLRIKGEIDSAIQEVIASSRFIRGPIVDAFNSELSKYLGIEHVIACGNGTDALQIALMALQLEPGDEVIIPAFTYIATAEVIALLGLTPVLVDVDHRTFNIDASKIEDAITERTRCIMPVHLFGQGTDMNTVMHIASKHDLYVIEDNAQSIGAKFEGKPLGGIGHIGTTSFFPSKNLGCYGDGGALFTNDAELAEKCFMIGNHGQEKKYYHSKVGINSRLDAVQAAVLRVKLRHLDKYVEARQKAAAYYDSALEADDRYLTPFRDDRSDHVFHQYTLTINGIERSSLRADLSRKGIPSMVYYPLPVHLQEAYTSDKYPKGLFPIAEELCEKVISIPMHSELKEEELSYICTALREYQS